MAASARIDELRSKFEQNPRRYFAPLANEYRKAGELGTAISVLRTQLKLFPQHMSGHVILGQALYEAGSLDDAREVLERAVELDAENLIALRHLGDIAREVGDTERARTWYRRVLEIDPHNAQVTELLDELDAHPTTRTELVTPSDVAGLTEVAVWPPPLELEPEPPPADESTQFIDLAEDDFLQWTPPAADVPSEPEPAAEPTFDPVVGLDLVPTHDEAAEQLAQATLPPAPEPVTRPLAASEDEAPAAWIPEEGAPLELARSDAFATETMAELCLEQGHSEEALAIYERLVTQRPNDSALADRARTLRDRLHAEQATAPVPAPEPTQEPTPEPAWEEVWEPVSAPETQPAAEAPPPAAPVPDARDEWAASAWAGALRTDVPVTEPLLPPAPPEPDLSFDRFFEGATFVDEPMAPPPAPAPLAPTPAPAIPAAEPASEEKDLADFNAWLKGIRDS